MRGITFHVECIMKSVCFTWFAALAVITGCGSDDAPVCMGPNGISVIDSLDVGTLSNTDSPDGLVAWKDGDVVELEYGSQGFLMLVVTGVVRGAELHRDAPQIEMTLAREGGTFLAQNGIFGGGSTTEAGGAWYVTQAYLAFEDDGAPSDGTIVVLRLTLPCMELERRLVIRHPGI
jgi:hypothetical protein